jgi:hypothetical protein
MMSDQAAQKEEERCRGIASAPSSSSRSLEASNSQLPFCKCYPGRSLQTSHSLFTSTPTSLQVSRILAESRRNAFDRQPVFLG